MSGIEKAVELAGSQTNLANKLGVSQQTINKWLKRGYVPLPRAFQIYRLFEIPVQELADPNYYSLLKK